MPANNGLFAIALGHYQGGRLEDAEAVARRILSADPNDLDSLNLSAVIAAQRGRYADTVVLMDRAIALTRHRPIAAFHDNIALAYRSLGQADMALAHFKQALAIDRNDGKALRGLATMLETLGKPEDAEGYYRRLVALAPNDLETQTALGIVLRQQGKFDEAIACYRHVLAHAPGNANAHFNLAVALREQGAHNEAIAGFERALALNPNHVEALNNLGGVHVEQGKVREGIAYYQAAARAKPDFALAHYNQSTARLSLGDYEEGWRKWEWRFQAGTVPPRQLAGPAWTGAESLEARTILLYAEQGYGDTLQFIRYAALAEARGARVAVECQPGLARLLATAPGVEHVVTAGEPLPPYDYHTAMMSLPLAFGTRLDTIPDDVPYLAADPADLAVWRQRLGGLKGLKVGLVWAGGPRPFQLASAEVDRRRSITLNHFAALAGIDGVSFVSLQKGAAAAQVKSPPAGVTVHDWTDQLDDFADTAALVDALDLVIAVDTAVVHLAGALGKPVWLLNRFDSCWRWLRDRDDSPWYPTLRQFRQPAPHDWDSVLGRVREELARLASAD